MNPHSKAEIYQCGETLEKAKTALILTHGRGGSAGDMLSLAQELPIEDCAVFAPQADGRSWYPQRFIAPLEANEPWLSGALDVIDTLVLQALASGIPSQRILLGGFSQGACLAVECAARKPRHYGAVWALSGALIGPLDSPTPRSGSLTHTPVYLGCAEHDAHIPLQSVNDSEQVLTTMGATVSKDIFPGSGHNLYPQELLWIKAHWPK